MRQCCMSGFVCGIPEHTRIVFDESGFVYLFYSNLIFAFFKRKIKFSTVFESLNIYARLLLLMYKVLENKNMFIEVHSRQ